MHTHSSLVMTQKTNDWHSHVGIIEEDRTDHLPLSRINAGMVGEIVEQANGAADASEEVNSDSAADCVLLNVY